jgi:hypothetical protein
VRGGIFTKKKQKNGNITEIKEEKTTKPTKLHKVFTKREQQ